MPRPQVKYESVERGITKIIRAYPDGRVVETYQIRYSDGNGKTQSESSFTTATKARAALARARTQVKDGNHISPGSADTKFLKVAEDWLASHPNWKERNRRSNEWTVRRKLLALHDRRMKQITTDVLLTFRADLLSTPTSRGGKPAVSSVKRTMIVLHAICEHARLKRHVAVNPCADLPALRGSAAEVVPPTFQQVEELKRTLASPTPPKVDKLGRRLAARPADPRWAVLVDVAAWTGLRAGELAGLKKSDINFGDQTLTVRRTVIDAKGGLREDRPKSHNSSRMIDLGEQVTTLLHGFTRAMRPSDYVFGKDGKPLRHNQFQGRVFRPTVETMGLGFTFHDLRHFHASALIASGMDVVAVSRRLGHADASITLKTYSHLFDLHRSRVGQRIDTLRDTASGKRKTKRRAPGIGQTESRRPF